MILKKEIFTILINIMFILVFSYEIQWFYQDFKSKSLCFLDMYPAGIQDLSLEIMLSPLKWGTEHIATLKALMPKQV